MCEQNIIKWPELTRQEYTCMSRKIAQLPFVAYVQFVSKLTINKLMLYFVVNFLIFIDFVSFLLIKVANFGQNVMQLYQTVFVAI